MSLILLGHDIRNPWSVHDLCLITKNMCPTIVFFIYIETLLISNKLEVVLRKLGFENYFCVDMMGRSGGLTLLWKSEINL